MGATGATGPKAASGAKAATGAPAGLRKHFENSEWFRPLGGWKQFAGKGDVSREDPLEIVPRQRSVWQEWDEKLVGAVPILPSHIEGM